MSDEQQIVNIKQRVVGAVVLVSLGVIIIPLLLNGGQNLTSGVSGVHIPHKPKVLNKELATIPAIKEMPAAKVINSKPVYRNPQNKENSPKRNDKPQQKKTLSSKTNSLATNQYKRLKKPDSAKINIAYTIQVASFSKKNNAISLRNKLRNKGLKSYSESIQTSKGKVYRLRVGPYLNYDQVLSDKKKIEKQFKLSKTVIVKYKT